MAAIQHRSLLVLSFYLICFGIVYGSLFPFNFTLDVNREAIAQFMLSWRVVPSRGDILGNIALFVPFGLSAYFLSIKSECERYKLSYFALVWLLVALGSQVAQLLLPSRDPSIFDLFSNAFGAILGCIVGLLLPRKFTSGLTSMQTMRLIPLSLPLLWLSAQLIPFVPTIDLQEYKNALKPLLTAPYWSWYECLLLTSCWAVFIYLLRDGLGLRLKSVYLAVLLLSIVLLKIIIVENNVSLTNLVAIAFALSISLLLKRKFFWI